MLFPDHETEYDLLGMDHLRSVVTSIVRSQELLPATIGVFGDWGSGKSSLIRMIEKDLKQDEDILVLSFNGWLFEGYDDAKTALMETIVDGLAQSAPKNGQLNFKKLAVKLLKKINWFRVAGSTLKYIAGVAAGGPITLTGLLTADMSEVVDKIGTLLENVDQKGVDELLKKEQEASLRRNIREFRKEFAELLEQSSVDTVVVVVDDLDRCLPNTIIETLEAIKLFLFVPGTAFIIGADERLVKYAVRTRFPELPGDRAEVGRDYLEKLIQYVVRIPPMTYSETANYIALLLAKDKLKEEDFNKAVAWALSKEGICAGRGFGLAAAMEIAGTLGEELKHDLALAEQIGPILGVGLNGNPRQCKRFLNTLLMRLEMAESRGIKLERRVLAKLMLLEEFRPQAFRKLAAWQGEQGGRPRQLLDMERFIRGNSTVKRDLEDQLGAGTKSSMSDTKKKKKEVKNSTLDPECTSWIDDKWLHSWLQDVEPDLGGVDLRPYFYFARETLTLTTSTGPRLSGEAQEILRQLFSESEAVRRNACQRAPELSASDAAAIFEELTEKVRHAEKHTGDNAPLTILLDWVEVRKEFAGELVTFLESMPDSDLPIFLATRLERICKGTPGEAAMVRYFERLCTSPTAGPLAQAARNRLKRLKGEA